MSPDQKRDFIVELCDNIKFEALERVGDMPDSWDGMELREYLADKFNDERYLSLPRAANANRKRLKEYRNAILVLNL